MGCAPGDSSYQVLQARPRRVETLHSLMLKVRPNLALVMSVLGVGWGLHQRTFQGDHTEGIGGGVKKISWRWLQLPLYFGICTCVHAWGVLPSLLERIVLWSNRFPKVTTP